MKMSSSIPILSQCAKVHSMPPYWTIVLHYCLENVHLERGKIRSKHIIQAAMRFHLHGRHLFSMIEIIQMELFIWTLNEMVSGMCVYIPQNIHQNEADMCKVIVLAVEHTVICNTEFIQSNKTATPDPRIQQCYSHRFHLYSYSTCINCSASILFLSHTERCSFQQERNDWIGSLHGY